METGVSLTAQQLNPELLGKAIIGKKEPLSAGSTAFHEIIKILHLACLEC